MTTWPNTATGATFDYLEFTIEQDGVELPVRYRVNASFYLSNYRCTFGQGCPGILVNGANLPDMGCCQVGVTFTDKDDFERVEAAVDQLTAEDWDLAGTDTPWYYTKGKRVQRDGVRKTIHTPEGTQVHDTGCVLANKAGGPAGKPGCALHHLAKRLGVGHWETKPDICWQIPYVVTHELSEGGDYYLVTVDGSVALAWGAGDSNNMGHMGYWCTETPDAYTGKDRVYVEAEQTLRHLMGDVGYEEMARRLDAHLRNTRMPGELANGGRPMLPLLIAERTQQWHDAAGRDDEHGEHARACLNR